MSFCDVSLGTAATEEANCADSCSVLKELFRISSSPCSYPLPQLHISSVRPSSVSSSHACIAYSSFPASLTAVLAHAWVNYETLLENCLVGFLVPE